LYSHFRLRRFVIAACGSVSRGDIGRSGFGIELPNRLDCPDCGDHLGVDNLVGGFGLPQEPDQGPGEDARRPSADQNGRCWDD